MFAATALTLFALAVDPLATGAPHKDGAGKTPPVKQEAKIGAFNATQLGVLQARCNYLAQQLNQSIIAAERYAHLSSDEEVKSRTHIRLAGLLSGLQKQWSK